MTQSKIETVARAVDTFLTHNIERDTLACDLTPDELAALARAAILAMRDPTEAMVDVIRQEAGEGLLEGDAEMICRMIIDAALGEQP